MNEVVDSKMARIAVALFCLACTCMVGQLHGVPNPTVKDDDPIVQTPSGTVRGTLRYTKDRPIYTFLGIPFGQPPIGELRFAAPVAADSWDDVYNATEEKPECIQISLVQMDATGQEDCLYLNVYTPTIPTGTDALLPVNVFVYGGSYFEGSPSPESYGPERFLEHDMVLVLMSYRMGSFGFISTNDAAASGNFGLLDQNLALKWVQNNIAAFGGDPTKVTLSGESAGSASVFYHLLSPVSAGLFQQVIAESGTALCPFAGFESPLEAAQELAMRFDCPTDDTTQLIQCLRLQDAGAITLSEITVMVESKGLAFAPVVENAATGVFLTEDPLTLLQDGQFNQVPLMIGFNRDEGGSLYMFTYVMMQSVNNYFFNHVVPRLLGTFTDFGQNLVNVSYAIKEEYYSTIDLTNETQVIRTHIDLLSDMFMKPWVAQSVQLISTQNVPVYMYYFTYVGGQSITHFTGEPDVDHGGELKYLFNKTLPLSIKDSEFSKKMMELWADFIIEGNPTPAGATVPWTPTPPGGTAHLMIDETFMMMAEYNPEKVNFWLNVVPTIVNG